MEYVLVEWMPEQHQASHAAAGGCMGMYPHDGSERAVVLASDVAELAAWDPTLRVVRSATPADRCDYAHRDCDAPAPPDEWGDAHGTYVCADGEGGYWDGAVHIACHDNVWWVRGSADGYEDVAGPYPTRAIAEDAADAIVVSGDGPGDETAAEMREREDALEAEVPQ